MMNDFRDLVVSGRFRPVIDRSYPLAEIVEAYRYVETGQKVGNVVITVEHRDRMFAIFIRAAQLRAFRLELSARWPALVGWLHQRDREAFCRPSRSS
jgi:hypothetical protein